MAGSKKLTVFGCAFGGGDALGVLRSVASTAAVAASVPSAGVTTAAAAAAVGLGAAEASGEAISS